METIKKVTRMIKREQVPKTPNVEHFLLCFPIRSGILFVSSTTVAMVVIPLLGLAFSYDFVVKDLHPRDQAFLNFMGVLSLVLGIIIITLHTLLIIGTLYKKPRLMLPWLNMCGIWISLNLLLVVPAFTLFPTNIAVVHTLQLVWVMHVFCVVRTFYDQIKKTQESETETETEIKKMLPSTEKIPIDV